MATYVVSVHRWTDSSGCEQLTARTSPGFDSLFQRPILDELTRPADLGAVRETDEVNVAVDLLLSRCQTNETYIRSGLHPARGPRGATWIVYED